MKIFSPLTKTVLSLGILISTLVMGIHTVNANGGGQWQDDGCDYECKTVTWTHKYCDWGWQEKDGKCRKQKARGGWDYKPMTTGNTFTVTYNKSQDPHKCHRPSTNQLSSNYGMNQWEAVAFTQDNPEWLQANRVIPSNMYLGRDNKCHAKTPVCEVTNPEREYYSPEKCENNSTVCEDPEAMNYNQEGECEYETCKDETATNYGEKGSCQYPNPSPTPESSPTPDDGQSGHRSSLATDHFNCENSDFEAVMDLKWDGQGKGDIKVTFNFNGDRKEATTNQDGRARVSYGRNSGTLTAEASDYPSQSLNLTAPENCPQKSESSGTPRTGQVLGISTLASTGNSAQQMAIFSLLAGAAVTAYAVYAFRHN